MFSFQTIHPFVKVPSAQQVLESIYLSSEGYSYYLYLYLFNLCGFDTGIALSSLAFSLGGRFE